MISFVLTLRKMLTGVWHAFKEKTFRTLFWLTVFILLSGTLFYHQIEKFTYLDALYYSVMTLTTVGSSDLGPQTSLGKVFTMIYTFSGIGVIFGFIYYVAKGIHTSKSS
ncbi:potassium channel family protein [Paenibacillus mendelii]|uniref:Potassium channel family protein n=1 Tax=Paenibacillus mendelii TaxID=206163 RepID=A0ABV6JLQ8_9BACL|nr:potassium channel family protein [Paenibacillus mendelii]MCQ6562371.1 potassium channel family protein [Paenibacillus mendelii]